MDFDPELIRLLMDTFRVELEEQLQIITDGLLQIEKGVEGEARQHTLDGIFRAAHNIKGAARGVEVSDVAEIAHHLESLFSVLKRQNTRPAPEAIDLCLESLDRMREAMLAFSEQKSPGFDVQKLIARLDDFERAQQVPGEAAVLSQPAVEPVPEPLKQPVQAESAPVAKPDAGGQQARSEGVKVNLEKLEKMAAQVEELQGAKIEMEDHMVTLQQLRTRIQALSGMWKHTAHSWSRGSRAAMVPAEMEALLKSATDRILELDGAATQMQRNMRASTNRLSLLSAAMQDDVRMMRLVPVSTLLRPMIRSVRDIARELGKQVEFEISGDEIEMDRVVLDGLRDPLVHLLRNAVDHGLESPEQRAAQGKAATGHLAVRVHGEGSHIIIRVEDDGAGISEEQISATALRKKIVTQAELDAMGREEVLGLIFRPGFSSKEIITNISGRGVGLDVVLSNLRSLKGAVHIDTEEGKGSTFTLRLPLTLATDHGLLVRAGGAVYAIPTTSVDRVIEIAPDQIIEVEASQALLLNGRAIPLRDLAAVLQVEGKEPFVQGLLSVVVVSKGWNAVAFVVEEVVGEREVVIKPFRFPLLAVRNVTGGTLTGNGEVIMVLNPADLVDSALSAGASSYLGRLGKTEEAVQVPAILVVDDSITTRTLERSILMNVGYDVTVAVDGRQAWDILQNRAFDLVVSDVEMPNMNGFELTEKIKSSERLRGIPVIIVTSLASETDRRRGIEVGADAYIVKGQFETKALLDVVKQLV